MTTEKAIFLERKRSKENVLNVMQDFEEIKSPKLIAEEARTRIMETIASLQEAYNELGKVV